MITKGILRASLYPFNMLINNSPSLFFSTSFPLVFWLVGFPKVWLCCFFSGRLVFFPDLLRQWQGQIPTSSEENFLQLPSISSLISSFFFYPGLGGIGGNSSRLGCDEMVVFLALLDNFMVTRLEICSRISTVSSIFYFCS